MSLRCLQLSEFVFAVDWLFVAVLCRCFPVDVVCVREMLTSVVLTVVWSIAAQSRRRRAQGGVEHLENASTLGSAQHSAGSTLCPGL